MRWEVDYRDELMEKEETAGEGRKVKGENEISDETLERFWECCEQVRQNMEHHPNPAKREKLTAFYRLMKKVAYIHSGRLSLEIDEETLEARLEYSGKSLCFMDEEAQESKNIVVELINQYSRVFIEPCRNGIRLSVEDDLYDVYVNAKDQELLDRIRKELREME